MDSYTKKYVDAFKQAETDVEIANIIDKIYEDGFSDGENNAVDSFDEINW